tara:strand:+ start:719 stop:928 length:210 start_codon:yes stop_codon:yes gene_type:complete
LFDLALCVSEKGSDLSRFGVIEVTRSKAVNKVAVSGVGGDASGTGVGLSEVSIRFKAGHVISDSGGRDV